jgi:hypothetical protein
MKTGFRNKNGDVETFSLIHNKPGKATNYLVLTPEN